MKNLSRFILTFLIVFSQYTAVAAIEGEMPVIAFYGVPDTCSNANDYRILKECGFTVNQRYYPNLNSLHRACTLADRHGVKILGTCPEMFNSPVMAANRLKQEKGFFGYMLQDEPSALEIEERQKAIEQLRRQDSNHYFYINLHPFYASWILEHTKTDSYEEYVHIAAKASTQQISFDYYPITTGGIRETWYYNLELIRRESLAARKPFWGFVCSVPHHIYPQPTIASLRLQVYSNLAYGAQAIQYFTYWTPPREAEGLNYHDGPVTEEGKKTKTWDLVRQMNMELKTVSKLFYGANIISVHHLGTIPEGTTRQTEMPVNLRSLKIIGRQGAIISQFEKNGNRYLAIVNKSHEQEFTVRIRTRNNTPRHLTKSLQEEPMKGNYIVTPGDVLLLKLK